MLRPTSMLAALAVAAATKHYGIVFDAGSSGTRIHVYTWQTGGGGPKDAFDLLSDDLLKIKPGLSAYKDKPSEAGASLAPLMEFAKTKIPASEVARTPMFLMATAGLRMVGEAAKDAILASVCSYLSSTGYLFRCGWATLLDGRDEGLYGWVTVNYLLNALYPGGQEASGIIDLGGGSVQIVFPTTIPSPPTSPAVAALTQTLDFNGRQHPIYVKSHLGYGLDAARNAVLDLLVSKGKDPAVHPCLPKGATATHKGVALTGSGDHHKCKKLVKRIFHDDDCVYGKHLCSINGVYQPQLPKSFYGFSYMYDRTKAIGLLDGTRHTAAHSHRTGPDQDGWPTHTAAHLAPGPRPLAPQHTSHPDRASKHTHRDRRSLSWLAHTDSPMRHMPSLSDHRRQARGLRLRVDEPRRY